MSNLTKWVLYIGFILFGSIVLSVIDLVLGIKITGNTTYAGLVHDLALIWWGAIIGTIAFIFPFWLNKQDG